MMKIKMGREVVVMMSLVVMVILQCVGSFSNSYIIVTRSPQCSASSSSQGTRFSSTVSHKIPHQSFVLKAVSSDSSNGNKKKTNPGAKLDFDEDYYSVLEASPFATFEELKKAYYKLVSLYHPDTKQTPEDKAVANQQMMVINSAYKVLRYE